MGLAMRGMPTSETGLCSHPQQPRSLESAVEAACWQLSLSLGSCLFSWLWWPLTMTSDTMITSGPIPLVILVTVGLCLVTLGPAAAFQPFISVDQEVRISWDQTKTITRWLGTSQAPAQPQHFSIIQNYGVSSENTENVRWYTSNIFWKYRHSAGIWG